LRRRRQIERGGSFLVAVDFASALTSTPDISLHRGKCREGPILLQKLFEFFDEQ
jgi:hypothetical protein